jgi:hypothetical protein
MSDEQRPSEHEEPGEEVEAHHHARHGANDEERDETENADDNEVEAHHHARNS